MLTFQEYLPERSYAFIVGKMRFSWQSSSVIFSCLAKTNALPNRGSPHPITRPFGLFTPRSARPRDQSASRLCPPGCPRRRARRWGRGRDRDAEGDERRRKSAEEHKRNSGRELVLYLSSNLKYEAVCPYVRAFSCSESADKSMTPPTGYILVCIQTR
jgi:hypothetical protein